MAGERWLVSASKKGDGTVLASSQVEGNNPKAKVGKSRIGNRFPGSEAFEKRLSMQQALCDQSLFIRRINAKDKNNNENSICINKSIEKEWGKIDRQMKVPSKKQFYDVLWLVFYLFILMW